MAYAFSGSNPFPSTAQSVMRHSSIKPFSKKDLERLYLADKLSMAEIARRLDCSGNKVAYWMNKHGIARRNIGDAIYQKSNPDGDPYKIKQLNTRDDFELFKLTVGLYIGEGTNNGREVRLANADPQVIGTFLKFLREICGVTVGKIFAWLNVFDDIVLEDAQVFWEDATGLSRTRFFKPTIRPHKKGSYRKNSQHGTLTVGVVNRRLAQLMAGWCQEMLHKYN